MGKLKLNPDPTFREKVEIHVPGGKPEPVIFTFKYRTRDEVQDFLKELEGMDDVAMIMAIAKGWELDDEFNRDNVNQLVQSFIAAPKAILERYLQALTGTRAKN
jgi:hypothetical protein